MRKWFGATSIALVGLWFVFLSGFVGEVDLSHWPIQPKSGYAWASENQILFSTKWSPGSALAGTPNVVAAEQEETWLPSPGYEWNLPPTGQNLLGMTVPQKFRSDDLSVHWLPGQRHQQFPHIYSAKAEGVWSADKGYNFTNAQGGLEVAWTPGAADPDFKHQIAGNAEGTWVMEPGYVKKNWFFSSIAVWVPNTAYPGQPCIVSATQEGRWQAIQGYHFQTTAPGAIEIVSDTTIDGSKILGGGLLAGLSYAFSPNADDDSLGGTAQRLVTDEGMKAGVNTVIEGFQSSSPGACSGVRVPRELGSQS